MPKVQLTRGDVDRAKGFGASPSNKPVPPCNSRHRHNNKAIRLNRREGDLVLKVLENTLKHGGLHQDEVNLIDSCVRHIKNDIGKRQANAGNYRNNVRISR